MSKCLFLIGGLPILATMAIAVDPMPAEQFNQLIHQLHKKRQDDVLRQTIVKVAPTLNPAPTLPKDTRRYLVRGARNCVDCQE